MQKQFTYQINAASVLDKSFNEPKGYLGYAIEKFRETEYIYRDLDE